MEASVSCGGQDTPERWDGTGYPDKLTEQQIPVGSRIVAVADAFGAMTAERPYSAAITPQLALNELQRCAGTQFDPVVVDAFCEAWTELRTPQPTEHRTRGSAL